MPPAIKAQPRQDTHDPHRRRPWSTQLRWPGRPCHWAPQGTDYVRPPCREWETSQIYLRSQAIYAYGLLDDSYQDLNGLGGGTDELSENVNKETENPKQTRSGLKNTVTEMNGALGGSDCRLN